MRRPDGHARLARFKAPKPEPENTAALSADHPAVVEGRTLFPGRVLPVRQAKRLLISGVNNAKIGGTIEKGPWAGMPVFTLTLEERATCPRSCEQWRTCYGNAMQWPARWDHTDPEFLTRLEAEVTILGYDHPEGFVVRLHVLGDFYSGEYVYFWARMLAKVPALRVYGYTARTEFDDDPRSARIARAIRALTDHLWSRFAIRTSTSEDNMWSRAIVVETPEEAETLGAIVCPAQTSSTETCGTCGLCWSPNARDKVIAFLRHGMKRATGPRPKVVPTGEPSKRYSSEQMRDAVLAAAPAIFAAHPDGATAQDVMKAIGVFGQDGAYNRVTVALSTLATRGEVRWDYAPGKSSKLMRPADWKPAAGDLTDRGGLSPAQAALFNAIKAASVGGRCAMGRAELAERAGIKYASFGVISDALEQKGRVVIERGGKGSPNVYRIVGDDGAGEAPEPALQTAKEAPPAPEAPKVAEKPPAPVLKAPAPAVTVAKPEPGIDLGALATGYGDRSGLRPLTQIGARQCHWPVGEPSPIQLYCGEPSLDGLEYCHRHAGMMFASKAAKAERHV